MRFVYLLTKVRIVSRVDLDRSEPRKRKRSRSAEKSSRKPSVWRSRWFTHTIAAALAAFLQGKIHEAPPDHSRDTTAEYSTESGARKHVTLPDGSTVDLNSRSRILVTYSPDSRTVVVVIGEALFNVKHETHRPFRIRIGRSIVEDVATSFNVLKKPGSAIVSVVKGKIIIYSPTDSASQAGLESSPTGNGSSRSPVTAVEFGEHQQIEIFAESGALRVHPALSEDALSRLLAWRKGRVEFEDTPLEEAVEEFNRYHEEKLTIADAVLGEQPRLTGAFDNSNLQDFLRALQTEFHIRSRLSVDSDGTRVITLYPASSKKAPRDHPRRR